MTDEQKLEYLKMRLVSAEVASMETDLEHRLAVECELTIHEEIAHMKEKIDARR